MIKKPFFNYTTSIISYSKTSRNFQVCGMARGNADDQIAFRMVFQLLAERYCSFSILLLLFNFTYDLAFLRNSEGSSLLT